jgi:hypothetical protein
MNKFKQLQLVGTLIVTSPIIFGVISISAFKMSVFSSTEVVDTKAEPKSDKDSVFVLKEVKSVKKEPIVVKKPIAVPLPPPTPKPESAVVVVDTTKKVNTESDTLK